MATAPRPGPKATMLVALWAIVMIAVVSASGCYGRNCEGDVVTYGRNLGEGRMVSADKWESMPFDAKWLPFPRQRVWVFEMKDLGLRTPFDVNVYLSAQEDFVAEDGNFTPGGGNLTEISGIGPGRMTVKNGTCADYYLRVVAEASPQPPSSTPATPGDAGTTTDAASGDAGDAEAGP
ncbi:MAG: hypothetical protein JST00_44920 [Deltaproteobacteria bacterium]|nr:hypothetical protein [Deltaproteobacteria bacterium]